jgi:hypothetical protein
MLQEARMDQGKQIELLVDIHARVKSIEDRLTPALNDHEKRLRILESARHYFLGVTAAVAAAVYAFASFLKNMLSGT